MDGLHLGKLAKHSSPVKARFGSILTSLNEFKSKKSPDSR
jgi:hypothetical protein